MSVRVGKIKAIPIRLHFTLILAFFLISWTLASRLMPELYPGLSISSYWLMGVIGAIILFASVLLHELAHALVALRYGLRVRQIILFIFGGVSEIDEEESSKDFRKEFSIAVVGPITSFIISAILSLVWLGLLALANDGNGSSIPLINTDNTTDETLKIAVGILYYGAFTNVLLGGFNLIPAFPLDGGRILRSALLRWRKDYDQATKVASKIGIGISYGFIGLGFLIMIGGSFISGIWLVFIGWFLNSGAQSYLAQHELTTLLSKVRLGNIMNFKVITVTQDTTVYRLIHEYFNTYSKDSFPVVDDESKNHLIGMVTFRDARNVPNDQRNTVNVRDIMINKSNVIVMNYDRTADEALMQMTRRRMSKVFICDPNGGLIGLVSKTDIMNAARERKEFSEEMRRLAGNKTEEKSK